ncbi:polysaccharide deacetylase family protein [Nocardioides ochotonae]|uniref:polysaccharide deacetylase family protein n=1 Tax=Nocardioides ochotonae TaxID=2685869 RepID=UPI00174B43FD|nr:polysaccharide deacetylase family protein [Nocardioides ochotonae]
MFSFDDGDKTHLTLVKPTLDAAGIKGTFGIVTSEVGVRSRTTSSEIRSLRDAGYEIDNHPQDPRQPQLHRPRADRHRDAQFACRARGRGSDPPDHIRALRALNGESSALAGRRRDPCATSRSSAALAPPSRQSATSDQAHRGRDSSSLAAINGGVVAKELLVVLVHSATSFGASARQLLVEVIDYIQSLHIPITASSAEEVDRAGNVVDSGDLVSCAGYAVDADGTAKGPDLGITAQLAVATVIVTTKAAGLRAGQDHPRHVFGSARGFPRPAPARSSSADPRRTSASRDATRAPRRGAPLVRAADYAHHRHR